MAIYEMIKNTTDVSDAFSQSAVRPQSSYPSGLPTHGIILNHVTEEKLLQVPLFF